MVEESQNPVCLSAPGMFSTWPEIKKKVLKTNELKKTIGLETTHRCIQRNATNVRLNKWEASFQVRWNIPAGVDEESPSPVMICCHRLKKTQLLIKDVQGHATPFYSFIPLIHHFASVEGIRSSRQHPALFFADVSDSRALSLSALLPSFF